MTLYNKSYIPLLLLPLLVLTGCRDDEFFSERPSGNPDAITFSAYAVSAAVSGNTRSGDEFPEYEPLVLTGDGEEAPLYLHTYETNKIGYIPGETIESATRANQITSAESLEEYHTNFKVLAKYKEGGDFFDWADTKPWSDDKSIWFTNKTHYWPGNNDLTFYAVSPASEVGNLKNLDLNISGEGENQNGTISFTYTAGKYDAANEGGAEGNDNTSETYKDRDAELQPDLLLATSIDNKQTAEEGRTKLQFSHALSAVKFAVRDVLKGEVISVKIKGIYTKGKCEYDINAADNNTDNPSGTQRVNGIKWTTDQSEIGEYIQKFNHEIEDGYDNRNDFDKDVVLTDKMPEKTFMLIPQKLPDDATIEVVIKRDATDLAEGAADIITVSGKIISNGVTEWKPGHEYVYTISTSKSNWTYVFNVTGSVQEENDENPKMGAFNDSKPFTDNNIAYDGEITVNATVTEGSYYKVQSYRYRTNNPSKTEPLKWTGVPTDGENQGSDNYQDFIQKYQNNISMTVSRKEWFPEIGIPEEGNNLKINDNGDFSADGSVEEKQYKVKFKTQYVATDWEGDWKMRATEEIGTEDNPIDLSYNNAGKSSRNTANCYVVNRGGWYKFPLIYGNAITDGTDNKSSYTYDGETITIKKTPDYTWSFSSLKQFTDYNNSPIYGPEISGAQKAKLVWQDAYGIIDQIELIEDNSAIKFHVARPDLQQSNSVIAVCDENGDIIWSWHIWVNEQMVDENQKLVPGIECDTWYEADANYGPFEVARRNLGWCDPKKLTYLGRTGTITFKQEGGNTPDKIIKVTQREKLIEFYIGNNTYYQWGRKDPMVGFRYSDPDNNDLVKYNFGELPYGFMNYTSTTIAKGIRNPNLLLAGTEGDDKADWLNEPNGNHYYNLWNNSTCSDGSFPKNDDGITNRCEPGTDTPLVTREFAFSGIKTIYDPSPAGYMVPPQGFFEIFTKGKNEHNHIDFCSSDIEDVFNGSLEVNNYNQYKAYTNREGSGEPKIELTPTGQRWHRTGASINLGGNMNPNHVYLWPNSITFYEDNGAFSFVVGKESGGYASTTRFRGRKSIARPIRCVKEYENKTLGR